MSPSLASQTLSAGRRLGSLRSGEGLDTIALPELLTMNFALAIAADNLNYATVVTYGGALCGVQQGAHGRVSSARQVWEADATRESDSEPA